MSVPERPPAPPPPPPAPSVPSRPGRLAIGLLFVLIGGAWLLEALDVTEVPWEVLFPGALILVGLVLLADVRSGRGHGGLIATGIVLTVVLALGSAVDVPIGGGVGERSERPASIAQLREEYRLGIGQLELDLSGLHATVSMSDSPIRVRARVGIGRLLVIVPAGVPVTIEGRAALGNVRLLGDEGSGIDVERDLRPPAGRAPVFALTLSVGIGQVEVRDG